MLFEQSILVAGVIIALGEFGMLAGNRTAILVASYALLLMIIGSKIIIDLDNLPAPDTAFLLLQFMATIFLMEASACTIKFRNTSSQILGADEVSQTFRISLNRWAFGQLRELAKLFVSGFLLSLALLIIGSVISVSVNQLALTGALALGAVVTILFLLTFRREPQTVRAVR